MNLMEKLQLADKEIKVVTRLLKGWINLKEFFKHLSTRQFNIVTIAKSPCAMLSAMGTLITFV